MDPRSTSHTRRAGGCTGATTRPTTGRRAACRAEIRPATHALYGYVRTADEIVDGPRRPASAEARRAALDAWERELHDGLARAAPRTRSSARSSTPGAATGCRSASWAPTCARCGSTARPCASRAGRSSRPTWTARPAPSGGSWPPLLGVPERHHAGFGRLGQAFQLANFIRDVREDTALDRVYLPAERPRALRRRGGATWRARRASPELRALRRLEVRARADAVRRAPSRPSPPRPPPCARASASPSRVYLRVLDRVERIEFDVLGRAHRRARRGSCPARRSGRCADDAAGDAARRRAHAAGRRRRARRRPDLRRELRRARRRPRAGRLGRRRARRRPLRDRRAPDVRLRGPDALARGDGRRARRSARRCPCMAFHTPHGSARFRLPWCWSAFDYRTLCEALWAQCRRALRGREGRAPRRATSSRPIAGRSTAPADRRRARLAPRARRRGERASRPRR